MYFFHFFHDRTIKLLKIFTVFILSAVCGSAATAYTHSASSAQPYYNQTLAAHGGGLNVCNYNLDSPASIFIRRLWGSLSPAEFILLSNPSTAMVHSQDPALRYILSSLYFSILVAQTWENLSGLPAQHIYGELEQAIGVFYQRLSAGYTPDFNELFKIIQSQAQVFDEVQNQPINTNYIENILKSTHQIVSYSLVALTGDQDRVLISLQNALTDHNPDSSQAQDISETDIEIHDVLALYYSIRKPDPQAQAKWNTKLLKRVIQDYMSFMTLLRGAWGLQNDLLNSNKNFLNSLADFDENAFGQPAALELILISRLIGWYDMQKGSDKEYELILAEEAAKQALSNSTGLSPEEVIAYEAQLLRAQTRPYQDSFLGISRTDVFTFSATLRTLGAFYSTLGNWIDDIGSTQLAKSISGFSKHTGVLLCLYTFYNRYSDLQRDLKQLKKIDALIVAHADSDLILSSIATSIKNNIEDKKSSEKLERQYWIMAKTVLVIAAHYVNKIIEGLLLLNLANPQNEVIAKKITKSVLTLSLQATSAYIYSSMIGDMIDEPDRQELKTLQNSLDTALYTHEFSFDSEDPQQALAIQSFKALDTQTIDQLSQLIEKDIQFAYRVLLQRLHNEDKATQAFLSTLGIGLDDQKILGEACYIGNATACKNSMIALDQMACVR